MSEITNAVRRELSLLTPDQVCELLQVKKDWIYDQVQAKQFPHVRLGKQLRFRPDEVAAYISGTWAAPVAMVSLNTSTLTAPVRRRGRPRKS